MAGAAGGTRRKGEMTLHVPLEILHKMFHTLPVSNGAAHSWWMLQFVIAHVLLCVARSGNPSGGTLATPWMTTRILQVSTNKPWKVYQKSVWNITCCLLGFVHVCPIIQQGPGAPSNVFHARDPFTARIWRHQHIDAAIDPWSVPLEGQPRKLKLVMLKKNLANYFLQNIRMLIPLCDHWLTNWITNL